jgi:hypothetical protein
VLHNIIKLKNVSFKVIMISIGWVILSVIALWYFFCTIAPPCSNTISQELFSPDGKLKAVVFKADCGATTDFSTEVSVLEVADKLPSDGGNVVFVEDSNHGAASTIEVNVIWSTNRKLTIKYDKKARLFLSKPETIVKSDLKAGETVSVSYDDSLVKYEI